MTGTVDQAIAWARAQIGQPYLYGGEGAGGFDCSGLIQMAFRAAGVALPRTAQQQYDSVPKVTNPAPGDLVFFGDSPSNISHVALYLGGGKMLDAPHTGAQVRVENVWSGAVGYGRPMAGSSATSSTTAQLVDAVSTTTTAQPAGFLSSVGDTLRRFSVETLILAGGVGLVGLGVWKGTTVGRRTSSKVKQARQQTGGLSTSAAPPAAPAGGGKGKASTSEGAAAGETAAVSPEMVAAL